MTKSCIEFMHDFYWPSIDFFRFLVRMLLKILLIESDECEVWLQHQIDEIEERDRHEIFILVQEIKS